MSIYQAIFSNKFERNNCVVDLSLDYNYQIWTYHELNDTICCLMNLLLSVQINSNQKITVIIPNSLYYIVSFFAITEIGLIVIPMNCNYTQNEIENGIIENGSRYVLITSDINLNLTELSTKLGVTILKLTFANKTLQLDIFDINTFKFNSLNDKLLNCDNSIIKSPSQTQTAIIVLTSGTTSRSKKVPLTHENILFNINVIAETYKLVETSKTLLVMPLFHVHGLIGVLLSTLISGGTVIIPKKKNFSATTFWKDIYDWKVTWVSCVPTIIQILLMTMDSNYDSSIKHTLSFIRSASSSLAPSILKDTENAFQVPVIQAYAMSEASHQISSNPYPGNGHNKVGSVGISKHTEIRILLDNDQEAPRCVVGEICIKGKNVIQSYLDNPEANKSSFIDGWLRTGDIGYLDYDNYLFISGRLKDIINRGGEKINPIEIDECYLTHPSVLECITFGISSCKYGEEVNCALVTRDGKIISDDALKQFAENKLAKHKIPSKFYIIKEIPKSGTGKIQRQFVASYILGNKSQ